MTDVAGPMLQVDEWLLLLDSYFDTGDPEPQEASEVVIDLAQQLNRLPLGMPRQRSAQDIVVALRTIRLAATGASTRSNVHVRELLKAWSDKKLLRATAEAIRRVGVRPSITRDEEIPEGELLFLQHRSRELDSDHGHRALGTGLRRCAYCSISFSEQYGSFASVVAEIHDTTPLTAMSRPPRPEDLVIVCANCHRVLHRRRPWLHASEIGKARTRDRASRASERALPEIAVKVADLAEPLSSWLKSRLDDKKIEWAYHPRSNELIDYVRRRVLQDLLECSAALRRDALAGAIACDLNLQVVGRTGQERTLDLVLGPPTSPLEKGDVKDPLRKARISVPLISLETKSCMTAHAKAIPRLIGELQQSIDVVRTSNPDALALAVVVVNVATSFTSPTNLPGPNEHDQPSAAQKVITQVLRRVPVGPESYDAVAIVTIDFDNERRAIAVKSKDWAPSENAYSNALRHIAARYEVSRSG